MGGGDISKLNNLNENNPASDKKVNVRRKYIKPFLPVPEKMGNNDAFGETCAACGCCDCCSDCIRDSFAVGPGNSRGDLGFELSPVAKKRSIALELTLRCPLQCAHCCIEAGPDKLGQNINEQNMYNWIEQISEVADSICFTGGETFAEPQLMKKAIEYSHIQGLKVAVITSGFWAKTLDRARKIMQETPKIDILDISHDEYHDKYLTLDFVVNAVQAALERGVSQISLRGIHIGFRIQKKLSSQNRLLKKIGKLAQDPRVHCWSQPMSVGGRANLYTPEQMGYKPTTKLSNSNSCFALETIFIDRDGYVYPCCSSLQPLQNKEDVTIGNLCEEPLKDILNRLEDAFLPNMLYKYGPSYLVRWMEKIKGKEFTKELRNNLQMRDSCQLCAKMFMGKKYVEVIGKMKDSGTMMWSEDCRYDLPLPQGSKMLSIEK